MLSASDQTMARLDKLALLGELSAEMAHEIRNPLTSISLNIQLLLDMAEQGSMQRSLLQDTLEGVERLNTLVQSILHFAKGGKAHKEPVALLELLESAHVLIKSELRRNRIRLTRRVPADLPILQVDRSRIQQVILNILTNAIRVQPQGGSILVTASVLGVPMAPSMTGPTVSVSFCDQGPGIPDTDIERIFQPYYTTRTDGTGLGLSISRTIMAEHGGDLVVNSRVGVGSTFTLYFPLQTAYDRATLLTNRADQPENHQIVIGTHTPGLEVSHVQR